MRRRRFLTIAASLAGAAALPAALSGAPGQPALTVWKGIAMGAAATLAFDHPDAPHLVEMARAEIARLESIFSLYRADSQLSRLNLTGQLDAPAPELLELLSLARAAHAATAGTFDPTVQPLWALHATCHAAGRAPTPGEISETLACTGIAGLELTPGSIRFTRPGMALTLNGIAQGYVADRIAGLLAAEGLSSALIDMGEVVALGTGPEGGDWPVSVAAPDGPRHLPAFRDAALATSAPLGTTFDAAGAVGHILDPRTGRPGGLWPQVSVTAPRAAIADALSTALCLLPEAAQQAALDAFPGARLIRI